MATTRSRIGIQIDKSTTASSVLVTDLSSTPTYLAPDPGAHRLLWYNNITGLWANLSLGSSLVISGTTLDATSAGAYTTVAEEGSALTARNVLNFIGSGFTATDDSGNNRTNITLDSTLNSLSQYNTNGILTQTALDTFVGRTLQGTTNRITVTNGDGVGGNPTINVSTAFGSSELADAANIALLNANNTFTGNNTFNNNIVMNASATLGTHIMTKAQVEALILDRKASSVDVATTVDINPDADIFAGAIVDGYTLQVDDRILVKDNAAQGKNGYYDVPITGPASRSVDMNTAGEVKGSLALVLNGTQAGLIFYTLSNVTTLGTDDIVFTQLATGTINGVGATDAVTIWQDTTTLTNDANFKYTSGSLVLGTSTPSGSTRFTTKGTGTGSSTFGWKHQNSSGTVTAVVADNGQVTLGSGGEVLIASTATNYTNGAAYAISKTGGNLNVSSDTSVTFAGGGTSTTVPSVLFNTTRQDLSSAQLNARFAGIFSPSGVGSNTYTEVDIIPVINQSTHTGASIGVHIHPTLTSVGSGGHTALKITATGQRALYTTAGSIQFDLGSDASYDTFYRGSGGLLTRLANTATTNYVLIGTSGGAPTWGPVPIGSVTQLGYIEGATTNIFDLDTAGVLKDKNGTNVIMTIPTNTDLFEVFLNGQRLNESGTTTTRDYSVNTTTHVLTLVNNLVATDVVCVVKRGG
jgi:hypothetical protein